MDLDLPLHTLEDSMTRAFLWSVLGTHGLLLSCGLNGAVRAASVGHYWLVPALGARLAHDISTLGTVANFDDSDSAHADFRGATDDRPGCEALSDGYFLALNLVLLDDCGLVTGPDIGLV